MFQNVGIPLGNLSSLLKLKGGSSKKRRCEEEPVQQDEDRVADGHDLDIVATNALRAKLGLKPLRT